MPLVSAREYARQRGISEGAVRKRTDRQGGPIPTHGPRKLIDVAEADALWEATMAPNGYATSRFRAPGGHHESAEDPSLEHRPASAIFESATTLSRARAALAVAEVQLKRLQLDRARGGLVDKQIAVAKAFAYGRLIRDAWLAWPARVGPLLAAQFERDAPAVTVALEAYVREHLEQLASERVDF